MKIENFARLADLRKKNAQFVNLMEDIRAIARKQWERNNSTNMTKDMYILDQRVETVEKAITSQNETLDVMLGMMEQVMLMVNQQNIKIVKSSRQRIRTSAPIVSVQEVQRKTTTISHNLLPEYLRDIRVMDTSLYMKNGRIYYKTIGLSPRDIQYNEFDLALIESVNDKGEVTFDISDLSAIAKRWSSFNNLIKEYVGPNMTLKTFVMDYAKHRGIPFTAKKRGRRSKNSEITTYFVEVERND